MISKIAALVTIIIGSSLLAAMIWTVMELANHVACAPIGGGCSLP